MSDYRLVFYDEVDDPYQFTLMFQLSFQFGAPLPKILQYMREHDDRYTPEFGIFAEMKNGAIAAGHLLMKIPTKTRNGDLEIGGVNAVGTRPDYGRRGIMTTIMTRTHEYFRERDLDYSLLTSSWRLGAMVLYEKMDYAEISSGWLGIKYPNQQCTPMPRGIQVRRFSRDDFDAVDHVFNTAVKGSYGLIYRPRHFLKARKFASGEVKWKDLRLAERNGEVTGYAHWETNPRAFESREIMALDRESFHGLLSEAERRNPKAAFVVLGEGLTSKEMGWLNEAGYQAPLQMYATTVVKSLRKGTDADAIKVMYGVNEGKFRLGEWDST